MPVLSEHTTLVHPSVSTLARRFTIAFLRAIVDTPIASVTAVTAGSPSGMDATASATARLSRSAMSSPRTRPIAITAATMTPASFARLWARPSSWRCNGVGSTFVERSRPAMRPISVDMPVPVTSSSARPRVTVVFMYAMHDLSPSGASGSGTPSVDFDVGWLSPVSADSSISVFTATTRRPSAGTLSPASMRTMSPGTMSAVGTETVSPPRRTRVLGESIFFSASSEASAFCSWTNPMMAFRRTTARTTAGVFTSPETTKLTTAAPRRMRMSTSRN